MEALGGLFALFVLARLAGEGAERIGQPAAVGELAAGVLAGVALALAAPVWPAAGHAATSDLVRLAAEAGIFFLVLAAGIEMKPREISSHSRVSFFVAVGGVLVPFAGGLALGLAFLADSEAKLVQAIFIGVALSITAIPTTVRILGDLGLLHTRAGQTVIAAAVFDDVIGLLLLAMVTALIERGSPPDAAELGLMVGQIALFFAITALIGVHVYPRLSRHLKVLQIASAEFGIIMAVAMGYGLLAEALGMHWIVGVFMAGLFFEPSRVGARAYDEMRIVVAAITGGFFGPLFFASIGLEVDAVAIVAAPGFLVVLVVVAVAGKMIGGGVPALLGGFRAREAAAIGAGMSSRGAVELVVIAIAVEAGLFALPAEGATLTLEHAVPSALVIMALATTLLAPLMLRALLGAAPPGAVRSPSRHEG